MPAKNPRISVILDKPLFNQIVKIAKRDGVSLSLKARDLLKEALEIQEDIILAKLAEDREETFSHSDAIGHDEIWT
jgi:hypothetical protein